jgi:hypothetical protein
MHPGYWVKSSPPYANLEGSTTPALLNYIHAFYQIIGKIEEGVETKI